MYYEKKYYTRYSRNIVQEIDKRIEINHHADVKLRDIIFKVSKVKLIFMTTFRY